MKRTFVCLLSASLLVSAKVSEEDKKKVQERLAESNIVLNEILGKGDADKGIPDKLLKDAHCAVVIPGMKKGGFIVGAKYGKGFMTCRGARRGSWGAPGAVRIEGGSFGLQAGGAETDVLMLVMNERGAEKLLGSKFTLGGDIDAAAGPVGRSSSAMTDAQMRAEILTWSRARGLFGGISLAGGTVREDKDDNEAMYGSPLSNKEIVMSKRTPPAGARPMLTTLAKHSPAEGKSTAKKAKPAATSTAPKK